MMFVPVAAFKIFVNDGIINLLSHGPDYGYFITASTQVFSTPQRCSIAGSTCFQGTGVNVCSDGRRYLGSATGTDNFV